MIRAICDICGKDYNYLDYGKPILEAYIGRKRKAYIGLKAIDEDGSESKICIACKQEIMKAIIEGMTRDGQEKDNRPVKRDGVHDVCGCKDDEEVGDKDKGDKAGKGHIS